MNENNQMLQSIIVGQESQDQEKNSSDGQVSPPSALSKEEEETGAIDDLLGFDKPKQANDYDVLNTLGNNQSVVVEQNFEEDDDDFDIFAESEKKVQIQNPLRPKDISVSTIDQSSMRESVTPETYKKIIHNNLMASSSTPTDEKVPKIQNQILSGKFAEMVSTVQQYILALNDEESEMNMFLNICLIFGFIKLKEYKNARSLSKQCIQKLSKSSIFGFSKNDDGSQNLDDNIPFSLKYMSAICLYLESNSRFKQKTLIELYQIQRNLKPCDQRQQSYICKQQEQIFGLFPSKYDTRSQYIMVSLEIFRIHQRAQDFRNAYTVLTRLNEKYPNSPMIISRLGRFCLEIGKQIEAISHFQVIDDMIQRSGKKTSTDTDALDLLSDCTDSDLQIISLLNQGFLKIFEGKYEDAIQFFRQVQTIRPANIVAANNLATCKIFLNKVGESIQLLEDLVKKEPLKNINEQIVQNLVSMYDIQYAHNPNDKKVVLADFCTKNSKDSVNAAVYVQHPSKSQKK